MIVSRGHQIAVNGNCNQSILMLKHYVRQICNDLYCEGLQKSNLKHYPTPYSKGMQN